MKTVFSIALGIMLYSTHHMQAVAEDTLSIDRIIPPSEPKATAMQDSAAEHAAKHADPNYICPMHPQIRQGEPGTCPICGMDLVLQEVSTGGEGDTPSVKVNPSTAQSMGIRTATVGERRTARIVNTIGNVSYNEDGMTHVHPRSSGWVEKFNVRAAGDPVKQGEVLLEYYSPEILNAQYELLVAKRTGESTLRASAENKLHLLDVPDNLVKALRSRHEPIRRIPISAPQDGVITHIGIRDGMYVTPATELYTITNLDSVWVMVDVFEQDMEAVKVGNLAEIRTDVMPGHTWEGKVDYVYPELTGATHTLQARIRFDMADAKLKPNMFVDVRIYDATRKALAIPREAVIPAADGARVVKVVAEGEYAPVEVTTGLRSGDYVEILDGLSAGDEIVVSGQFLLDSESNLQASFRRMGAE